ncbi:MAG: hypothetical protein Q9174_003128 [Haloplaca sp. 1 TL-2023]
MAEPKLAVASAVVVPEPDEQPTEPDDGRKRRMSPISPESSKRPRLNSGVSQDRIDNSTPPIRASDRRKNGQLEERKRGQRLFGALLGTLSQSSSSTAQKRRTDIEKKQAAKLKAQSDEQDEQKKERLEKTMAARRKEQKKYDKQSFYKPWELRPSEDARVKKQIEEAEDTIQREEAEFITLTTEAITEAPSNNHVPATDEMHDQERQIGGQAETVGPEATVPQDPDPLANDGTTNKEADAPLSKSEPVPLEQQETSKDQEDDGGEMVEADEDMVIY